ncbi:MAG: hypothetical protein ACTS43_02450 [Candidatus Hodgkinia cicadicola]
MHRLLRPKGGRNGIGRKRERKSEEVVFCWNGVETSVGSALSLMCWFPLYLYLSLAPFDISVTSRSIFARFGGRALRS